MAARSLSFVCVLFLFSCALSAESGDIHIENSVESCFSLDNVKLQYSGEMAVLNADIKATTDLSGCRCKSALTKYTVSQEIEGTKSSLLSGHFTVLGKDAVSIPIAVQKQLIFPTAPILITFSCDEP